MNEIEAMAARAAAAGDLAGLLEASCDALSLVESVCWAHEAGADGLFPAFMFAGTAAAQARLALLSAPSLPTGRAAPAGRGVPVRGDAGAIADAVAGLVRLLAERLAVAAAAAADPGDREACGEAAAGAAQVARLLSRGGR